MKKKKLFQKLLYSSKNIQFSELIQCAKYFGFKVDRVKGSHNILVHPEIPEVINLQNVRGKAKPYQIKQFLEIIERYNLEIEERED